MEGQFDVGMGEGRIEPPPPGAREPRRLGLVAVEARDEQDAVAKLKTGWRARYGDEPASPLIGISRRYNDPQGSEAAIERVVLAELSDAPQYALEIASTGCKPAEDVARAMERCLAAGWAEIPPRRHARPQLTRPGYAELAARRR